MEYSLLQDLFMIKMVGSKKLVFVHAVLRGLLKKIHRPKLKLKYLVSNKREALLYINSTVNMLDKLTNRKMRS